MAEVIASVLPYALGVILSPLSAIAIILLLVSDQGVRKGWVFLVVWYLTCAAVPLLLAPLVKEGAPDRPHVAAAWIHLLLGVALLASAVVGAYRLRHRDPKAAPAQPPTWMSAMDRMGLGKVVFVAVLLNLANPVNMAALLAATATLGRYSLGFAGNAAVALLFALACSLAVLVPFLMAVWPGRDPGPLLRRLRSFLVTYNGAIQMVTALVFGFVLVLNGVQVLWG